MFAGLCRLGKTQRRTRLRSSAEALIFQKALVEATQVFVTHFFAVQDHL